VTTEGGVRRRDPARSLAAVAAATLTLEAIVVLLAVPMVISLTRHHLPAAGVGYLLALPVVLLAAAGTQRRRHGVVLGTVAQPLVIAGGVVTWPLYVLGVVFGGLWLGYLSLRRRL
jgi:hypothetical protein